MIVVMSDSKYIDKVLTMIFMVILIALDSFNLFISVIDGHIVTITLKVIALVFSIMFILGFLAFLFKINGGDQTRDSKCENAPPQWYSLLSVYICFGMSPCYALFCLYFCNLKTCDELNCIHFNFFFPEHS